MRPRYDVECFCDVWIEQRSGKRRLACGPKTQMGTEAGIPIICLILPYPVRAASSMLVEIM